MNRKAVVVGLAAVGVASSARRDARASSLPVLRIGCDAIDSDTNLFVAMAEGFFLRAGVAVQPQMVSNGAAGAAALVAGALDITMINVASLLNARQRNIPFAIVALGEMYTSASPTLELLVSKTSGLNAAADLNGESVAVNALGGLTVAATRAWMDKSGGDSSSIRFVAMPFGVMPDALASKRIDAAFATEPHLSGMKGENRVLADACDAIAPAFLISAAIATSSTIAANRDALRRFNAGMQMGAVWANKNQQRSASILSSVSHVDASAIRRATRSTFAEKQSPKALVDPVVKAMVKYSALPAAIGELNIFSPDF